MKITNKSTKIKIGNRVIEKRNFFMNEYLKYFSKAQLSDENNAYNLYKDLSNNLYIKIDKPLTNITYDSVLQESDFELKIEKGKGNFTKERNGINCIYTFSTNSSFIFNEEETTNRSVLNGHKITALSFNLKTYLDLSEYDLYFINDEVMTIVKEDYISSDAICDGYSYPYHLSPSLEPFEYRSSEGAYNSPMLAKIYSVGLGRSRGVIEEEYVIGKDIEISEIDDTTFGFVLKKEVDSSVYPGDNIYPTQTTMPKASLSRTLIYPTENTQASDSLYPVLQNYDFIIVKYIFYYINRGGEAININKFYTMSYYCTREGILDIKIKIEREGK